MFFAKIVAIATLALGASASLVAGDYDGSAAVVSSSAPVVAATTTVSPIASSTQAPNKPKKCKKWTKKPEYVKKAVEAGLATGATASFDDAGLPQLIGEGGFQVAEEQQPVNEAPVVVQEPVAQEPVVQVPVVQEPVVVEQPVEQKKDEFDTVSFCAALRGAVSGPIDTDAPEDVLKADLVARTNAVRNTYGRLIGYDYSRFQVTYSDSAETSAQNYASFRSPSCDMVHSVGSQRVGLGENLAWWSDSRGQTPSIFARHIQALQMYVDECEPFVSDMKAGTGSLQGNTAAYGHLSQVLWRPSTTIGCGVCVTGNGREALSVCHYGPAGNMGGSNILGERL